MIGRDDVAAIVPRGTMEQLDSYVAMLIEEGARQNLIAASTIDAIWQRHILDSLQLLQLAPTTGLWIDIGSGAGLPGLVVAIASERPVRLVEPRARRAAFLSGIIERFAIADRVTVNATKVQKLEPASASIISARAVAPLLDLFAMASHLSTPDTLWLLPKGQSAAEEVAEARKNWQGEFSLVPSRTEARSMIVVASRIRRRGKA